MKRNAMDQELQIKRHVPTPKMCLQKNQLNCTSQVPRLGGGVDNGGPCEYLHWLHAKHFSKFMLFSRVQNLHDQNLYFIDASFGFRVSQASHTRANGCKFHYKL